LIERKRHLKRLIADSILRDVISGKYIAGRGLALFDVGRLNKTLSFAAAFRLSAITGRGVGYESAG
jgi:hypothetical protein